MIKKTALIAFFGVFYICAAQAQDGEPQEMHPIEQELDNCLGSDPGETTAGRLGCYATASKKWDAELKSVHSFLFASLTLPEQAKLKLSQAAWVAYRDKEFAFIDLMYSTMTDEKWKTVAAQRKKDIVMKRALELKAMHGDLR